MDLELKNIIHNYFSLSQEEKDKVVDKIFNYATTVLATVRDETLFNLTKQNIIESIKIEIKISEDFEIYELSEVYKVLINRLKKLEYGRL